MYLLCSSCLPCGRKEPERYDDFVMMLRWACSEENAQFEPLRQPLHPILTGVMRESFA
jgi:hypothetical protein